VPFLKLPQASIHYEVQGDGVPVIFIQGTGVSGSGWLPQTQALSSNFKTVIFDNRGVGQTRISSLHFTLDDLINDTIALIDFLEFKKLHIVGHSLGGVIARHVALRIPERVLSLSLLCTFSYGAQALTPNWRIAVWGLLSRVGTKYSRRRAFLRLLYSKSYLEDNKARVDQVILETERLVGRDLGVTSKGADIQLKALGSDRTISPPPQLLFPVLIVSASEDPIAAPSYGQDLLKTFPNARFLILDGFSHGVTIETPQNVNEILTSHFSGAA
jgi:pimeloyl-ACP methyl ester carboxylesterase